MIRNVLCGLAAAILGLLMISSASHTAAADSDTLTRQACKAGIALLMDRDPKIMKVEKLKGGIIYFHYIRPDDQTKWGYKCKLDGDRVIWASNNPDSLGRWRTHPDDGVLTFQIDGNQMHVRQLYSDSSIEKSFPLSSL